MSKTTVRVPEDEELRWILRRAVAEIIPEDEFVEALRSGRRLRLKMGFDPSAPDLTLGHAVGLRKLRQLQELGHQVVVIVGDWTARIGDPSGQSQTRPMLTAAEVKTNAETYLRQFFMVVDRERTEIRWQSEWFDKFGLETVVRLAARFTVAQMLQRQEYSERFAAHKPIGLHEFLYPLLQAYDSVAVEADVEFGGTDQKFNLLVGRDLQTIMGQRPQQCFLVPLLVGTDGKVKMSKSLGNYIALEDPPQEMYGKVMSLPDGVMMDYYELVTDVPDKELAEIGEALRTRAVNPMELKMRLAREIVTQFHSGEAAQAAEEEFTRVFRKREVPEEVLEFRMSVSRDFMPSPVVSPSWRQIGQPPSQKILYYLNSIPHILHASGLATSISEGTRLIKQGAVERGEAGRFERVTEQFAPVYDGMIIRVGKRRFLRIVDADKQS
ncbi:MAG: tyrosine--tRNA ligase [Dehalococcoidia bacterium]